MFPTPFPGQDTTWNVGKAKERLELRLRLMTINTQMQTNDANNESDNNATKPDSAFSELEPGQGQNPEIVEPEMPIDVTGSSINPTVSREYMNCVTTTFTQFGHNVKVWGIDVDKTSKRVYVTDKSCDRVRAFSLQGDELTHIGLNTQGFLYRPCGIAVDHTNDRLVISDKDNNRIVICNLDGIFLSSFGKRGKRDGEFHYPWGVAVSPNGELIAVADSHNHRLQMFDQFGNFLRKYQSHPLEYKSNFNSPRGLCFDKSGQFIYCTDFNLHTIFKFNIELTEKTLFVGREFLRRPQGVAIDEVGNVLVCDRIRSVQVFTPQGYLMANINGNGRINIPKDLCILPTGKLLILDDENGCIHLY